MGRRFAEGTTVTVESSRGEISGILAKHGVVRQAWASEPDRAMLLAHIDALEADLDKIAAIRREQIAADARHAAALASLTGRTG